MPTFAACAAAAYTPEAIRLFCGRIGVAKANSIIDMAMLEGAVREDLNAAPRRMAVLRPLKVVLDNYPEGDGRKARRGQQTRRSGRRDAARSPSRALIIERDDFPRGAAEKIFPPGTRRRSAAALRIHHQMRQVVKDASGEVMEVHCTYDPETRGGNAPDGRKVKGTLHWVSAADAVPAECASTIRCSARPERMPVISG